MSRRGLLWHLLLLLANGLLLWGIVHIWWSEEGTPAVTRTPGPEVPSTPLLRDTQALNAFRTVSTKNLFAQDRTGPELTGGPSGKTKSSLEGRQLLGVIIIGNDRAALIGRTATGGRSSSGGSKGPEVEVVHQGEEWEGFKVVEISNEAVVFQGQEGRKTLNFPD
ncbi:MAG: hypothetical protein FJ126_02375 [Deltaproteobacteria bacterium]|nr:hypothetical protein [Deltaproteobacteria bacterium]